MPTLRMFAGPNGSGKTTLQKMISTGVDFVNADVIEKTIFLEGGYMLPHRIDAGGIFDFAEQDPFLREHVSGLWVQGHSTIFADPVNSYQASAIAGYLRHQLVMLGKSLDFETVMSSRDKVGFLDWSRAQGHTVELHYVCTADVEVNIARVAERVLRGGHAVPEDLIRKRYLKSLSLLPEAVKASDIVYFYDNTEDGKTPQRTETPCYYQGT